MKIILNRLYVSAKRSFKNPYVYFMAAIILLLGIVAFVMPPKEASAYIPVAVLNNDDSPRTADALEELTDMTSIFHFYEVDSEAQMYADLATGAANTGVIFPEDMMEKSGSLRTLPDIEVITTPSSTLPLMSSEEVFMKLFPHFAYYVMIDTIERCSVEFPEGYEESLTGIMEQSMESNAIYHLESLENADYNDIVTTEKLSIPVYKFAGFFIWMAALLGALSFLNDCDNKLYVRMRKGGRVFMGLILPAVHVVPVAVVSIISFLIAQESFSIIRMLLYCFNVIVLSFAIATFFSILPGQGKKSRAFSAILPTYLILSFLFGGVLINLSVYSPILRAVSMIFPPYFF